MSWDGPYGSPGSVGGKAGRGVWAVVLSQSALELG